MLYIGKYILVETSVWNDFCSVFGVVFVICLVFFYDVDVAVFQDQQQQRALLRYLRKRLQEKTQENHYFPCNLG